MKQRTLLAAVAILSILAVTLRAVAQEPRPSEAGPNMDAVAFLTGTWIREDEEGRLEEHWIEPAGGSMLGVGRTIAGERTVFFDFMRIELRKESVVYVAQPGGGKATEFELTGHSAGHVAFENPEHDDPQRIEYEEVVDGELEIRLAGLRGGKPHETRYRLSRR